jgi:hypothetical protein
MQSFNFADAFRVIYFNNRNTLQDTLDYRFKHKKGKKQEKVMNQIEKGNKGKKKNEIVY